MANDPIYLTAEEAGILQTAVGRIVSDGIRLQDSDLQLPAAPVSPPADAGVDCPRPDEHSGT
jgi:hypothetical protein